MSQTRDDVKKRIKKFILDEFLSENSDLKDDELLFFSGIIDSLGMVQLTAFLEETFGVSINPRDVTMNNFNTINKITDIISKKLEENE